MLCPDYVSSLFSKVSTTTELQSAASAVISWRLNTALNDVWFRVNEAEFVIPHFLTVNSLTVRSCFRWMTELTKTDTHLPRYFTAVAFLHVAYKISTTGFTDELMDVLATITGQFISTRRHPSQCSSELSLSKAAKLMKVVTNSSHSTMQLVDIIQRSTATDLDTSELVELLQRSAVEHLTTCLLYTSPSPRDGLLSRMPSSA